MAPESDHNINIDIETHYIAEQSQPDANRYVFTYTITLRNDGKQPARLMTRHWVINHANGKVEEVRGEGVIGEQPYMRPGEGYCYTSGTILETPYGDMSGSYQMLGDDGVEFDAEIPTFSLTTPNTLH